MTLVESTSLVYFFFFNDTATTEIYTLSLHDALPISPVQSRPGPGLAGHGRGRARAGPRRVAIPARQPAALRRAGRAHGAGAAGAGAAAQPAHAGAGGRAAAAGTGPAAAAEIGRAHV